MPYLVRCLRARWSPPTAVGLALLTTVLPYLGACTGSEADDDPFSSASATSSNATESGSPTSGGSTDDARESSSSTGDLPTSGTMSSSTDSVTAGASGGTCREALECFADECETAYGEVGPENCMIGCVEDLNLGPDETGALSNLVECAAFQCWPECDIMQDSGWGSDSGSTSGSDSGSDSGSTSGSTSGSDSGPTAEEGDDDGVAVDWPACVKCIVDTAADPPPRCAPEDDACI